MENGNLYDVNLQSGLDVQSSDMLVPVTDVKAAQNRQLYQGGMLTTSFRYEQNGYAAGWCVYNFIFTEQSVPATSTADTLYLSYLKYNSNSTYRLALRSTTDSTGAVLATMYYTPVSTIISNTTGNDIAVDGATLSGVFNGQAYTFTYDTVTGNIAATSALTITGALNVDYTTTFLLQDRANEIHILPTDMYLPSAVYNYSNSTYTEDAHKVSNYTFFKDNVHTWGTYLTYNVDTHTVDILNDDTAVVTSVLKQTPNKLVVDYNSTVSLPVSINMAITNRYVSFSAFTVTFDDSRISTAALKDADYLFDYWTGLIYNSIDSLNSGLTSEGLYVQAQVPVWFGITIDIVNNTGTTVLPDADNWEIKLAMDDAAGMHFPTSSCNCVIYQSALADIVYGQVYTFAGNTYASATATRYCRVFHNDFIQASPSFHFLAYSSMTDICTVNGTTYYFAPKLPCLYNITYINMSTISSTFKSHTILSSLFDLNGVYQPISVANGTDKYGIIQMPTISGICNVIAKGTTYSLAVRNDMQFMQETIDALSIQARSALYYSPTETPPAIYSATQAAQAGADMWPAPGQYNGTTFVDSTAEFPVNYTSAGYWPFSYVPCFRLTIDGYDGPCYHWNSNTDYITTIAGYVAYVKSALAYQQDSNNTDVTHYTPTVDAAYNRTRYVYKCSNNGAVYDIDKPSTDAEMAAWLVKWDKWYGKNSNNNKTSPFSMSVPSAVKTGQYDSFADITFKTFTISSISIQDVSGGNKPQPTVPINVGASTKTIMYEYLWNTRPSQTDTCTFVLAMPKAYAVYALGDLMPVEHASHTLGAIVWEHTVNATDKYNINTTVSEGHIRGTVNITIPVDSAAKFDQLDISDPNTTYSNGTTPPRMMSAVVAAYNIDVPILSSVPAMSVPGLLWHTSGTEDDHIMVTSINYWMRSNVTLHFYNNTEEGLQRCRAGYNIEKDDWQLVPSAWTPMTVVCTVKPKDATSWMYADGLFDYCVINVNINTSSATVVCSLSESQSTSTFYNSMYGHDDTNITNGILFYKPKQLSTKYDSTTGICSIAFPLKAYIASIIRYPTVCNNAVGANNFTIETAAVADIPGQYSTGKIYIDRDGSTAGPIKQGHTIFSLAISDASVTDTALALNVYLCAHKSKPSSTVSCLFYATEAGKDIYIPGHILNATDGTSDITKNAQLGGGNLSYQDVGVDTTKALPIIYNIKGTANAYDSITSVTPIVSTILRVAYHDFYINVLDAFIAAINATVGAVIDATDSSGAYNGTQVITVTIGDAVFSITYHLRTGTYTSNTSYTLTFKGYTFTGTLSIGTSESGKALLAMTYATTLVYHIKAAYADVSQYYLSAYGNGLFTVYNAAGGSELFTYNQFTNQLTDNGVVIDDAELIPDADSSVNVSATYYESALICASLYGIYNMTNCTFVALNKSTNILQIAYNGNTYSANVHTLLNKPNTMDVTSTNVTTNATKTIGKVDTATEYMFKKQMWNTDVSIENFWWIDSTHILYLTKDKLVLSTKLSIVDDWNGDAWTTEANSAVYNRADYIDSTVLQYFVSNAYKEGQAFLCTVTVSSDSTFVLHIYDPLNNMAANDISIDVQHVDLGRQLNKALGKQPTLYSYGNIFAGAIVSGSVFTSTSIGNNLIIGIHNDNNYKQWAIQIDTTELLYTVKRIVQGYGYVGLDGSLTGGEIPTMYFDTNIGFNNIVYSIEDKLNIADVGADSAITSIARLQLTNSYVVGGAQQQWYISACISSIVSHLTFDTANGYWNIAMLPINNNYTAIYKSASMCKRICGDYMIGAKLLTQLLPDSGDYTTLWTAACILLGTPTIYYLYPKISTFNYLQQTLGQYAYVHYNSTSVKKSKDMSTAKTASLSGTATDDLTAKTDAIIPVSSDQIAFDLQTIQQQASNDISAMYSDLFLSLTSVLFSATALTANAVADTLQVNKDQTETSTSDKGKKYSQMFLNNINSMAVSSISLKSSNPVLKSEVSAVKTLDMFYSTSADQQICAGPGYVNHNFVAQCIAQSVTSTQCDGSEYSILFYIKELSMWQYDLEIYIADAAIKFLEEQAAALKGGGDISGPVSSAAATIFIISANVLRIAEQALKIGRDVLFSTLDSLGAGQVQSNVIKSINNGHTFKIEGKHAYGNKSECFMWPCYNARNLQYTNEKVVADYFNKAWSLDLDPATSATLSGNNIKDLGSTSVDFVTNTNTDTKVTSRLKGEVDYYIAACKGKATQSTLPDNMACIVGTDTFLSPERFKNENIGEADPVFTVPVMQDYLINTQWNLFATASGNNAIIWTSCKDTKLIDGQPSNIVCTDTFCGVAAPYTAIEITRGIEQKYLRPWAITPNALAYNTTGFNTVYSDKLYHAFDGVGYRLVSWVGSANLNKEAYTMLYNFQPNDRFKRSNKLPPNQFLGNFKDSPVMSIESKDKFISIITQPTESTGLTAGIAGEDKDDRRYALPIFTEAVNTLPAAVKAYSTYQLLTFDGITSLCTDIRSTQGAYKIPQSVDFVIGTAQYRYTNEYICSVTQKNGIDVLNNLVPTLGLTFLGATPKEAYLYSQSTRQYYRFAGGTEIQNLGLLARFRNVLSGCWDFVNQEVVFPCLATFDRLDSTVHDDADETDNIIIPAIQNSQVKNEVAPPITTIFNTTSWFKTLSLPSGLVYQGPNRCIINRFTYIDYMRKGILANKNKWVKVPREEYHPFRVYPEVFKNVETHITDGVVGWTHNPFLYVTAPLGVNESTDCKFEWDITFAWPVEMDAIYKQDEYICVNVVSETMTSGGKVFSRPTHIFLTKDLFTRTNNYGYYSFRYQGNNGIGNRERLHIWSDAFIAVSSIRLECKEMTTKRNSILTQQVDVQELTEF